MIDDESEGGDCDEVMHARCGEPGLIFLVKSNPFRLFTRATVRLSVCHAPVLCQNEES